MKTKNFVFWLPYWHTLWRHQYLICIVQKSWISLERDEIWQKGKHRSSSLLKAFQIRLFFNTSIFHFIGTLKPSVLNYSSFRRNKWFSKSKRFGDNLMWTYKKYWAIPSRNLQKLFDPASLLRRRTLGGRFRNETKQCLRRGIQNVTNILLFLKQVHTCSCLCL